MRTTITLENDVARRAKAARAKSGRTFKQVINDALRVGLEQLDQPQVKRPYRTKPMAGGLREGLNLANIGETLAQIEGEDRR